MTKFIVKIKEQRIYVLEVEAADMKESLLKAIDKFATVPSTETYLKEQPTATVIGIEEKDH